MRQPFGHLSHKIHAAMARRRGSFELFLDHRRRAQIRHDRQRHVAVADPFPLGQRIVVGAHDIELVVGIARFEERSARRIGKQHLGVDAVGIEHRQARLRIMIRLGNFFVEFRISRKRLAHQSRAIGDIAMAHLAIHRPAIYPFAVFFGFDDLGNLFTPLSSGHALGEIIPVKPGMGIRADQFMLNFHRSSNTNNFE